MFSRVALHKSWDNSHLVQQVAVFNDPNLSHRDQMEDSYFFEKSEEGEFVFGVLDGHNGQCVAEVITKNLPSTLFSHLKKSKNTNKSVEQIFEETFLALDEQIEKQLGKKAEQMGSTCTCCLVRVENGTKIIYTANLGDSSAFLYNQDQENSPIELSTIHRASNEQEVLRIKEKGSYVSMGRIEGQLEVFRAFGDLRLKKKGLIAIPSVSRYELNESSANPSYQIVVASDGLWDFCKMNEIDNKVKSNFGKTDKIAKDLKDLAKISRSQDNITVMSVHISSSHLEVSEIGI